MASTADTISRIFKITGNFHLQVSTIYAYPSTGMGMEVTCGSLYGIVTDK